MSAGMPGRSAAGEPARMSITYAAAIVLILKGDQRTRSDILSYFAEDEHGNAGRALDEMVLAGDVGFDRFRYRLQPGGE